MKSKVLSQYRFRIIYVAFSLTVILLIQNHIFYCVLAPFFIYYMWTHHKDLLRICVVIIGSFFISKYLFDQIGINDTGQLSVKVIEVNNRDTYYQVKGTVGIIVVNIYLTDAEDILIGSRYNFIGELEEPIGNTIPHTFDYKNYLYSNRTKYIFYASDFEYERQGYSLSIIRDAVSKYIDNTMPHSKSYIKTFLLADKYDIDQDIRNGINTLGISHMFAVSGYHIGLLVVAISYGLNYLHLRKDDIENIIIVILVLYMIITAFTPSVVRASLLYVGIVINRRKNLKLSVLDILSTIYIVLIIINPYIYYNIGFILSFFITLVLILTQNILRSKSKLHVVYYVSLIAFLASFPIVLNMNYQINLLTLIYNILIIYIMTVVILPISYITFVFPIIDHLSSIIYDVFNRFILYLSCIETFIIHGYINAIWMFMIIYIMIMFIFIKIEQKSLRFVHIISLLLLVGISQNLQFFNPIQQIVFLDVDGDSTLIRDGFNQCNILIDTGEMDSYDSVIHYLYSMNIRQLDFLIISHFHSDHYGEVNDVMDAFDVDTLITSNTAITYSEKNITCGKLQFYIYPLSNDSMNENNNSIVLSLFISNTHYLFVGDSEVERELEIMNFDIPDVDYLKVGHHGSITSSSEKFIDYINPDNAIVIVHRDNSHNHPSEIVMDRYSERKITIFRTDQLGTIQISYLFGKERKKYYSP